MTATSVPAASMLRSVRMQDTRTHVANSVSGEEDIAADTRTVRIRALDGFDPADWDRVSAALNAHDDYLHWDYCTLPDGRMEWTLTYPKENA